MKQLTLLDKATDEELRQATDKVKQVGKNLQNLFSKYYDKTIHEKMRKKINKEVYNEDEELPLIGIEDVIMAFKTLAPELKDYKQTVVRATDLLADLSALPHNEDNQ